MRERRDKFLLKTDESYRLAMAEKMCQGTGLNEKLLCDLADIIEDVRLSHGIDRLTKKQVKELVSVYVSNAFKLEARSSNIRRSFSLMKREKKE